MSNRTLSLSVTIVMAAVCLLINAGSAEAEIRIAYVWGDQPAAAAYAPNGTYVRHDDADVKVNKLAVGRYRVAFGSLIAGQGNVQVSSYGQAGLNCQVASWGAHGVDVSCYNSDGRTTDGRFTVLAVSTQNDRDVAYVWASDPEAADYTPSPRYSWSPGGAVRIKRTSTGRYQVALAPPVVGQEATVQVTAYGGSPRHCGVVSWAQGNVGVQCSDAAGRPADAQFSLLAVKKGAAGDQFSFAWANEATRSEYSPSPAYAYAPGASPRVQRNGRGRYRVTLNGVLGNIQVTAYGGAPGVSCNPLSWSDTNSLVACVDAEGRPVDARFTLLSTRRAVGPVEVRSELLRQVVAPTGVRPDVSVPSEALRVTLRDMDERLHRERFLRAAVLAYQLRRAETELAGMTSREFQERILVAAGGRVARGINPTHLASAMVRQRARIAELTPAYIEALEGFASRERKNIDLTTRDVNLTIGTPLAPDIERLGVAISLSTLLNAPGMGADRDCTGTPFVILDDAGAHSVGPLSLYLSAVASLWDGTTSEATARAHVLGRLSELLDALQCLSTRELARFEGAYSAGMIDILNRLSEQGSRQIAHAFWDATLPVTLLLYDAVKYFEVPVSYYLLRYPAAQSLTLPELNRLAPARLTGFNGSLASRLYCASSGGTGLMLNRLGMWFEDASRADPGLGQVTLSTPCDLLRDMTDLVRLGEGDCPMLLFTQYNNGCPSRGTCESYDSTGGEFNPSTLTGPLGEIFSGAGASAIAPPGLPGSSMTHFGTPRGPGIQESCNSTGGGGAPGCFMPDTGSVRPGSFSPDPELDRIMRCSLVVNMSGGMRDVPQYVATPNPGCFAGKDGDDAVDGGDEDEGPRVEGDSDVASDDEVEEAVRDGADEVERQIQDIIRATSDELQRAGFGRLSMMQQLRLNSMLHLVIDMARDGRMLFTVESIPGVAGGFAWSTAGSVATQADGGWIVLDAGSGQADLTETVTHELVHAALSAWAISEAPRSLGAQVEPMGPGSVGALHSEDLDMSACARGDLAACSSQHRIIHRSVGYLCDEALGCTSGCRYVDPRVKALTECVADIAGPPRLPSGGNPCATALSCPRDTYVAYYDHHLSSCVGRLDIDIRHLAACSHVLCGTASLAANLSGCCRPGGLGVGGGFFGPPAWCDFLQMDPPPPGCPGASLGVDPAEDPGQPIGTFLVIESSQPPPR